MMTRTQDKTKRPIRTLTAAELRCIAAGISKMLHDTATSQLADDNAYTDDGK